MSEKVKDKVCTSCGYVGEPINQCLESFMLDAFIWLVSVSVILMTALLPVIIIPVLWTLYHIINFKSKCPKCGDLEMVSLDSTKGKARLRHSH